MQKKLGFIGFGSMGSMLMEGFIKANAVRPDDVYVSTRTREKLHAIQEKWPDCHCLSKNSEVAQNSDILFLCVKPMDFLSVLYEIKPYIKQEQHLVSIAGAIQIAEIEERLKCQVTKLIPAITSLVNEGISLVCHGPTVKEENKKQLEALMGAISTVKVLSEKQIPLATELTSCAPGFFASLMGHFIQSAQQHDPQLSRKDAEEMVVKTMYGTMKLVLDKGLDLDEIIARVATKGGITQEGVKVFNEVLPPVYDKMFEITLDKRRLVEEKVCKMFDV